MLFFRDCVRYCIEFNLNKKEILMLYSNHALIKHTTGVLNLAVEDQTQNFS